MDDKEFKTSDMFVATFLKAKGFKVLRVEREGRKAFFCFDETSEREQAILDYYNEEALISARGFVDSFHAIKALIFESNGKD